MFSIFFICLLAISTSSFEKYLFKSFTHFKNRLFHRVFVYFVPCIFCTLAPNPIYDLQIFSLNNWVLTQCFIHAWYTSNTGWMTENKFFNYSKENYSFKKRFQNLLNFYYLSILMRNYRCTKSIPYVIAMEVGFLCFVFVLVHNQDSLRFFNYFTDFGIKFSSLAWFRVRRKSSNP